MAEEGIYAGADGAGAGAGEPSSGGGVGAKTPPLLIAGQPAARVGGAAAVLAAVVLVVVLASGGDEAAADAAADGSPQGPRLVTSWGGAGGSGAGGQVARVTISASHMQNSHTGGYVFASIVGTAADQLDTDSIMQSTMGSSASVRGGGGMSPAASTMGGHGRSKSYPREWGDLGAPDSVQVNAEATAKYF